MGSYSINDLNRETRSVDQEPGGEFVDAFMDNVDSFLLRKILLVEPIKQT